jgi:hypothetical protein
MQQRGLFAEFAFQHFKFVLLLHFLQSDYILVKYPAKILSNLKSIKGIAMRMGVSCHCKMSCLNEFVGAEKVKKSKRKE